MSPATTNRFTAGTTGTSSTAAAEDTGGGLPGWAWAVIVASAVFIAGAVLVFTRTRRRST